MLKSPSRRRWLKAALLGVLAVPLTLRWARRARAGGAPPLLEEHSTAAQSIGYVADTAQVDGKAHPKFKAGQTCRNCSLYHGEPGEVSGGCELVLGNVVLASAWCDSWEAKPAGKDG